MSGAAPPDPDEVGEGELTPEQQLYKENILDHYRHPRNKRAMEGASAIHSGKNPLCGDTLTVSVRITGAAAGKGTGGGGTVERDTVGEGIIEDIAFEGHGCAISQASMSMLTERLKGMTAAEAKAMTRDDITRMLGIPIGIVRMKCAMLGLRITQEAIAGITPGRKGGKNA